LFLPVLAVRRRRRANDSVRKLEQFLDIKAGGGGLPQEQVKSFNPGRAGAVHVSNNAA
jgi:hypothetical protein